MNRSGTVRAPDVREPPTGTDGNVLLATFDVPFDARASIFAVDSAVESGRTLIVANIVELQPRPQSIIMRTDCFDYTPELEASLVAPAALAQSLGVTVERLRIRTLRRVESLIELASERDVRLLVLGPDRDKVSPRLYRKAAAAVRDHLSCLVWSTWELPIG